MNTSIIYSIPASHTTPEPLVEIPIRHETESKSKGNNKQHNRKFPGPSLQEQRDFLNGFNREEYYKNYVR